ncbi:MAG: class I tRNA ligase family protein, partial [Ruminococcus sp.]|nr:class I tRNA ligase family protein [Ruminococcus sp.]
DQWFCSVDDFKDDAVKAINEVEWIPAWGKDRITSMVRERKDWCISRQRKWGVPIPIFYCRDCGEPLIDKAAMLAVADVFAEEGSNTWFDRDASEMLPEGTKCSKCGCASFDKEKDIMDVWFDSGSSHTAVVKRRGYLKFPADLYLEGNDQYRGWFQSSLLTSVATMGVAPYKTVLTHGMILDMEKRKMSKSLGNGISPQEVIKQYGADVLRLWVASCDYQSDVNISFDILKQRSEAYRKVRNTARYILGNLFDFNPDTDMADFDTLLPIDKWALAKLNSLIDKVREAYDKYEFHIVYHSIHNFCVVDMSNFYLDVLKDRLYTEKADSPRRRAAQTAMYLILNAMTRMIAPILAYTSDEIWKFMPHSAADEASHVIYNEMPEKVAADVDDSFMEFWNRIHELRDDVKKTLEPMIKEKTIKSSLEAKVTLSAGGETLEFLKQAEPELADAFIVSEVVIADNGAELEITAEKAEGEKCERCWAIRKSVGADAEHPTLCAHCCETLR